MGQREPGRRRPPRSASGPRAAISWSRLPHEDAGRARAFGHAADRLGPGAGPVQDLDLRLRGGSGEGHCTRDGTRWMIKAEGVGRRSARVGHEHHHSAGQGPPGLAVGRPDVGGPRSPASTSSSSCARPPEPASDDLFPLPAHLQDSFHDANFLQTRPRGLFGVPDFHFGRFRRSRRWLPGRLRWWLGRLPGRLRWWVWRSPRRIRRVCVVRPLVVQFGGGIRSQERA